MTCHSVLKDSEINCKVGNLWKIILSFVEVDQELFSLGSVDSKYAAVDLGGQRLFRAEFPGEA